ncbi:MAG: metal-dependent amidase/aminoacylase/carboxypeptidase family protein [Planctomycetota bacterium]|jgi:metal-dependent amidase/aminoacylase/carboxypeptidase family protein
MNDLIQLRKNLHRLAEPSGEEARTAMSIAQKIARLEI